MQSPSKPTRFRNTELSRSSDAEATADSIYPLPSVVTDFCPVLVSAEIPAYGTVRTPLNVSYKLFNLTDSVVEIVVSMELAEAFMFSGHKQVIVGGFLYQCHTYVITTLASSADSTWRFNEDGFVVVPVDSRSCSPA